MPHRDLTEIDHELLALPLEDGEGFDLEIGIHLSQQCMEDVFVLAIEGGSNYWADFRFDHGRVENEDGTINYKETLKEVGIDIFDVDSGEDFLNGCNAPRLVHDKDDREHRTIFLWNDWVKGFELYGKSNYARGPELMIKLMQNDASEADAEDADMILQFACFGEIIFG